MSREVNRRQFVAATTSAGVGLALTGAAQAAEKPALLGGKPVRTKGCQSWPMVAAADEESVWFSQKMFLGPRSDMDEIAEAVRKIQTHAPALVRA